jgi:hypothetical protein
VGRGPAWPPLSLPLQTTTKKTLLTIKIDKEIFKIYFILLLYIPSLKNG